MLTLRPSAARGAAQIGWLDSKHSFSFGSYYDQAHMGFGPLRVINEDKIKPRSGFGAHPHRDMEIITYVLEGALEHKDSLGTGSVIVPGDVQRMSAGTGIVHSEYNPLDDEAVHLLQIWIEPEQQGIAPGYEQKNFSAKRKSGQLTLLAAKDGRDGSLTIHQDASLYVLDLDAGQTFHYTMGAGRMAWVQMARGEAVVNGHTLKQGDAAGVRQEKMMEFTANQQSEILIFDLAERRSS
ncbi:MAG: pirin family protein [Alphaproteobacteria bacterium]|nr:pirin family protein [Alphaproteobacteria bacterium]